MRFSRETRDFFMRQETGDFLVWGGNSKPEKSWDFLMRQEIFSWDRRQEIFSLGGNLKVMRHDNFSWDMRYSRETGDRRFPRRGSPTRKYPVSRENLMSHAFSINPTRQSRETRDSPREDFGWKRHCCFYLNTLAYKSILCLAPWLTKPNSTHLTNPRVT